MASAWLKYDPARSWVSRKTWTVAGVVIAVVALGFVIGGMLGAFDVGQDCRRYCIDYCCSGVRLSSGN